MNVLLKYNPPVFYGFVGYKNLGDESIWEASSSLFSELNLMLYKKPRIKLSRYLMKQKVKSCAILGGGTLIGANKADGSNSFRDDFQIISNNAKFNVVFGTGVGALAEDVPEWLRAWKPIIENCGYVGVRGPRSQVRLKKIGIESEVLGDTACQWVGQLVKSARNKKKLGINIGATEGLITAQGFNNYVNFLRQRIQEKWDLIFFVINPDDLALTERMISCLGITAEIRTACEKTTSYLSSLEDIDYFIGTRLHSVILAMTKPIPSLMLGYADKAHDFMESVEMESLCVDINTVSLDQLNEVFSYLTKNNNQQQLFDAMVHYRELQRTQAKNIIRQIGRL